MWSATGKTATSSYSQYRGGYRQCTPHYIREVVLSELVLAHMKRVLAYVQQYEDLFVRVVNNKTVEEHTRSIAAKRKTLGQQRRRIAELDVRFQKVFEGNASGTLSDERFLQLSTAYENEQATLKQETAKLESELAEEKQSVANTERFLSIVRKYTEIETLSPTILHDFIEKIVIHAPDYSSGKRRQKVEIFYNAVGILDVISADEMVDYLKTRKSRKDTKQATTA